MELNHLLNLIGELTPNSKLPYVRDDKTFCTFVRIDKDEPRVYALTEKNDQKQWAPSYLNEVASKIKEYEPFNLSQLLNNKGTFRPIIDTIIAHTSEFYRVRQDNVILVVWNPKKKHEPGKLVDCTMDDIPQSNAFHYLERPIADFVTKHDNEQLSYKDLVNRYKTTYMSAGSGRTEFVTHMFGIQYAPHFEKINSKSFVYDALGKGGSLGDNLGRAIKVGLELRKHIDKTTPQINIFNSGSTSTDYGKFLAAIRTKPFLLLAGISGTGKSRIVRKLAQASVTEELQRRYDPRSVKNGFDRWSLHKPANFELIQVKPNWHNSMEVVGYKSNIGGSHYEFTPFVEFVARAWQHQDVPFFLCLDEMNLAPVEQYFAEFLSAIESRSMENGEYITDPIVKPFVTFGENVCADMIDNLLPNIKASGIDTDEVEKIKRISDHFKTKGLTLPKNLIVMGTVNMDETTFSFSRKVLDRAMSIEMNTVNFDDFVSGASENDVPEMSEEMKAALIDRPLRGREAPGNDVDRVKDYLTQINEKLENTPFKLGYRAINEALLYVSASRAFGNEDTGAALDEFTLMKILSRIEGDKRSLGDLLEKLTGIIPAESQSGKKLHDMKETLKDKQFVSYWT